MRENETRRCEGRGGSSALRESETSAGKGVVQWKAKRQGWVGSCEKRDGRGGSSALRENETRTCEGGSNASRESETNAGRCGEGRLPALCVKTKRMRVGSCEKREERSLAGSWMAPDWHLAGFWSAGAWLLPGCCLAAGCLSGCLSDCLLALPASSQLPGCRLDGWLAFWLVAGQHVVLAHVTVMGLEPAIFGLEVRCLIH